MERVIYTHKEYEETQQKSQYFLLDSPIMTFLSTTNRGRKNKAHTIVKVRTITEARLHPLIEVVSRLFQVN